MQFIPVTTTKLTSSVFVDDHLINSLIDTRRKLHHPTRREIAITFDLPWEGTGSGDQV